MSWISDDIILQGKLVRLEPLSQKHFDELISASQDVRIWTYLSHDGLNAQDVPLYLDEALLKKEKGLQYPFTIINSLTNKIIGTTRFWKISEANKKLEIGWTWLHPDYWGGGYNQETKYLLLDFCFEKLNTFKVGLVASEDNLRSRAAIEKIGAKLDGVLRKERICSDGVSRGFAYYSITDDEWPIIKQQLKATSLTPKSTKSV